MNKAIKKIMGIAFAAAMALSISVGTFVIYDVDAVLS